MNHDFVLSCDGSCGCIKFYPHDLLLSAAAIQLHVTLKCTWTVETWNCCEINGNLLFQHDIIIQVAAASV